MMNSLQTLVIKEKDKPAKLNENNVIYQILCKDCDASYVGETQSQLGVRIGEHKNNIKRVPQITISY